MPVFELELTNGKKFQIETDRPPTEAEIPELLASLESGSIQEMNQTESLQTPMVGMGGTGGVQGLMNPAQLSGALPMAGTVPPLPQPSGSLQQYIGLNQQRQQIEAAALDERSKIHSYPFVDMLQRNVGYNPTAFTGQVDPAKFQPLFPQDPVQKEILAEIEQKRVQDLAKLAVLSQQQGFEKMPGTELPDITKPMMSFGIRPNTVQAALGTGPTTSKVISGLQQAAAGVPETFSSPLGMAAIPGTIPKLVGQTVPKLVTGGFVADMTAHLPEQARMAKEAIDAGDAEGAARALGSIALTGIMLGKEAATYGPKVGKAFRENTPITPEVLPKQDRPIGPQRQLGEQAPIDVETTGPAQITQARRFYQSESKNPPVDASQLTQVELAARLEVNKPLEQLPAKRTYEGGPIVIGENQPQNIAKSLGIRYDGIQDYGGFAPKKETYTSLDPKNPFTLYVDVGTPKAEVQARLKEKQQQDVVQTEAPKIYTPELTTKPVANPEGGKISFSAPAESGAIPSARQSALPIGGEKAIPPQEPQMGQGAKMIGEPIKDSQPKSKSPINESELSVQQNIEKRINEYGYEVHTDAQGYPWLYKGEQKVTIPQVPKEVQLLQDQLSEYGYKLAESGETLNEALKKKPTVDEDGNKLDSKNESNGKIEYYHSGIPITKETLDAVKDLLKLPGKALNLYAEPIVEKLGRVGGPVAKKATEEFQRMISRQKQVYGELSPVVDAAKKATGKLGGGNVWLRKTNNITDKAAVNNLFASNEGGTTPPTEARQAVNLIDRANLAIGKSAQLANPDFVPTGKLQRVLTNYGYDVIRRGNGPAWEAWTEGVAKANGVKLDTVKDFFSKWKEELDKPASDIASMDRISQDFSRKFPKTVSHIKPGMAWHEVVVADPYNYIESAAQRTSHAVAFREVYPLVPDPKTGKLGPSGYLQATRKAIQKELNTAGFDSTLFDNLVSAVQGHPLDTFTKGWNAPDSPLGGGYRMGQQLIGQPLKTLMLTANTVSNFGEILTGGPAIFLGYRNVIPAMVALAKDRSLEKYLEFIGARNQAMYNWSIDPTSPGRTASRLFSNVIRFSTAQQLFNEIQESTGAMSTKFVADRIRNKELSKYETGRIESVAKFMGFTQKQAEKLLQGDEDLLRQFETKAASMFTGGNQAMAEKSRLGTSRAFNELFWFQTYPQMKANQARKLFGNLFEDINNKNWKGVYHNAALIGRFAGGTTLQGAITLMLMGLAGAGIYGWANKKNEAKEDTVGFAFDSMKAGMGGPLAILHRLAQNSKDSKSLTQNLVSLSPPVSAGQDLIDAAAGTGRYEGRTGWERVGMFLDSKAPGLDMAKTFLATWGLSEDNLELRAATKGFYEWRREQPEYKPASSGGGDKSDLAVRVQMKRVKEAIQSGKDWKKELEKVKDLESAKRSLQAGTMLEINTKPLSDAQIKDLEKKIGKKGVETIKLYDAMLREIARELGDVNKETKSIQDIKPTGDKYVDQTTGTQRSDRVAKMLKPETIQFLELNKKKVPSFEPEFGLVNKKLMTKEQGERFEKLYAEELDKRLASVITNQVLMSKPLVKRQERIQERIELAKEMAQIRFRAQERASTSR